MIRISCVYAAAIVLLGTAIPVLATTASELTMTFREMHDKILQGTHKGAFLAALDQSGGSTPKALASYGLTPELGNYEVGTESMFDAVHAMRTRIMTSPFFTGEKILGAILFEDTMDRTVDGRPTCQYLWDHKDIVPFLKIDKGLEDLPENGSVQMLQPIPNLQTLLERARSVGVYGTKARSLIVNPNHPEQIDALVKQQFELAREVLNAGLIPIIEPEVNIHQETSDKQKCEQILARALVRELEALRLDEDESSSDDNNDDDDDDDDCVARSRLGERLHKVMIKITLPEVACQYQECVDHPCCLKVVALSGGYNQEEANKKLEKNNGVIASFSRALSEGLSHGMTEDQFNACLATSISRIYDASAE